MMTDDEDEDAERIGRVSETYQKALSHLSPHAITCHALLLLSICFVKCRERLMIKSASTATDECGINNLEFKGLHFCCGVSEHNSLKTHK